MDCCIYCKNGKENNSNRLVSYCTDGIYIHEGCKGSIS